MFNLYSDPGGKFLLVITWSNIPALFNAQIPVLVKKEVAVNVIWPFGELKAEIGGTNDAENGGVAPPK